MPPRPANPTDRAVLIFVSAMLAAACIAIIAIAGVSSLLVAERVFRELPWLLLWVIAAAGFGRVCVDRLIDNPPPMLRWSTRIVCGFGVISLLMLGVGLLGALNRPLCVGMMCVGVVLAPWNELWVLRGRKLSIPTLPRSAYAWLPFAGLAGIVLTADCVPPGLLWSDEPHGYDVVEYHLQVPREWYEAGRITTLEHNVFSFLPMNVEMHYLLAMELHGGPWAGMYLATMMNTVFILVALMAIGSAMSWRAALLMAAVPWVGLSASICYVEAGLLMFTTLGVVWTIRATSIRVVIVAGAMIGFACGTKLTAIPMLLGPLSIFVFRNAWERRAPSPRTRGEGGGEGSGLGDLGLRETLSPALSLKKGEGGIGSAIARLMVFVIVVLLLVSPWLVRDYHATGNPLFPEAQSVLGRGTFTAAQQTRWDASLQPPTSQRSADKRLKAFAFQTLLDWRWGFVLLPLAALSMIFRRDRLQLCLLAVLAFQIAFWLFFTHLQGRFFLLALPVAVIMISRVDAKAWHCLTVGCSIASAIVAICFLSQRLWRFTPAIDVDDLRGLLSQQALDAIDTERPIALIGDANPFWYPVPMTLLSYRTVFDVKATPDQLAAEHWLDPQTPENAERIVNDSELRRLCRTYREMPQPPME